MNIEEKIEILKKVNIFSEADEKILYGLAGSSREMDILKGKKIFRKGDEGDALYILVEGTVRIHDGNYVLAKLGQGEVFGEYALIDKEKRSATVTAEEKCRVLKILQSDFYGIAEGNRNILRGVLKVLIGRMREMNELEEKLSRSYLKIQKQKEQIEARNQSIKDQKAQLEQQNYDLTKLNEEKNHLISILVHQIKNPLTSSLCLIDMLKEEDCHEESEIRKESLDVISNSLRRINNLVNEELDIDSIDSKVFELKYQKIRPDLIIKELIDNYGYLLDQKRIEVTSNLDKTETELNKVYFTQVVDNLISNAFKVTPAEGKVNINLSDHGQSILLEVSDEGPGFPEEKARDIFSRYERQTAMQDQHKPPEGLGLAIVKKYTDAMDGKVWVESNTGKGSSFLVEFPKVMSKR